jgi:hypothetical protein
MDASTEILANYQLFAPIRERFQGSGVERGGFVRAGLTPVNLRTFGEYAATIYPNLAHVEASFTSEQLTVCMQALTLLKGWVQGKFSQLALSERIVDSFWQTSKPYFGLAALRSSEEILAACIAAQPEHAPTFDAIFRVAGSEGMRDLIQFHATRLLGQTLTQEKPDFPDILGFVNLHERIDPNASFLAPSQQYEVWCPGQDLAKVFFQQCQSAAQRLIEHDQLHQAAPRESELRALPVDLVSHLTSFVQAHAKEQLRGYALEL